MALNDPLVRFESVRFGYPGSAAPVLDGLDLELRAGDGVALLGANGAGKTTTLRLAMALLQPQAGRVEVAGRQLAGRHPEDVAGLAGYLFQDPASQLFAATVEDEVAFGPRQLGWDPAQIGRATAAVLEELALGDAAAVHPYDLPGPRRRLVALAATLVAEPAVLLLDEPTAGLDRATRGVVRRAARARRERGVAVLAVTHDADFALETLDTGVVIRDGRALPAEPLATVLSGDDGTLPGLPPPARLARGLGLETPTLRVADVARALATHCRSR